MTAATLPAQVAGKSGVEEHRSSTRNHVTSSGETRSQLFQRLRAECVWDHAECLKEQVRAECRNRGEMKRQAGISAWNAIARAYPKTDVTTWHEFHSRSLRPPLISQSVDWTHEVSTMAGAWCATIRLSACLATRCPRVADNSEQILNAIDSRRSLDSSDGRILSETDIRKPVDFMIESPNECLRAARAVFSHYEPPESDYGRAVADELNKLIDFMGLLQELADEHWGRIRPWLFGPRQREAQRFLARACEKSAALSTRTARRAR